MNSWHIRLAAQAILEGGVIAYPSEAVYGLGCSPWDEQALARILRLKRRSWRKGLIVVAADVAQLASLVEFHELPGLQAILESWPGPVTWVLPARRQTPALLRGRHDSLAVRVSAHPQIQALCRLCGPLVSTSANVQGAPPARDALAVRRYFRDRLDFLLAGRLGEAARPSEIRDGLSGAILRPGG